MADTKSNYPVRIERALTLLGACALGCCAFAAIQARFAVEASSHLAVTTNLNAALRSKANDVIGTISIPALRLSAPVTNGIESIALIRGVGHIPGTAVPGGLGTMGLAGHRDTFFRSLRNVKPGMEIRVSDGGGSYHYIVSDTEIVTPDQLRVLDIVSRPELVLITCYPFDFIGAAPKRFIVHAALTSVLSDETGQPNAIGDPR